MGLAVATEGDDDRRNLSLRQVDNADSRPRHSRLVTWRLPLAVRRLGDAVLAVVSPQPLEAHASVSAGWPIISLPPASLGEPHDNLTAPDPTLETILKGVSPPPGQRHGRVIAVVATGGEPAARLAIRLARLAQHEDKGTLLVDAKLGNGRGLLRGSPPPSGLADYLTGSSPLAAVLRRDKAGGLAILPAGNTPLPASTLLSAPPWRSAVAHLRRRFRTTVLVAPPVGEDGFSEIARCADGVLVLVDREATPAYLEDRAELVARIAPKASVFIALVYAGPSRPSRPRDAPRAPGRGTARPAMQGRSSRTRTRSARRPTTIAPRSISPSASAGV